MNFKEQIDLQVKTVTNFIADTAGSGVMFLHDYWVLLWLPVALILVGIGLAPLRPKGNESTAEVLAISTRKILFVYAALLLILPLPLVIIFQAANRGDLRAGVHAITSSLALRSLWLLPVIAGVIGLRFWFFRKLAPRLSRLWKKVTISQATDTLADIRSIGQDLSPKIFNPEHYYRQGSIFLGKDSSDQPIYVDLDVYLANHTQIIGATGWGKGTLFGCIIDQLIWQGVTVFYSDPKHDEFIPHIMYQRCKKVGRNFVYYSFYDDEPGEWGPFLGGSLNDARERLGAVFGIGKDTGDNSAIHKARELRMTKNALNTSRTVDGLFQYCELEKEDSRITTELDIWRTYRSVCARSGGFSIAESLKRGDVVYIKGFIMDKVMKSGFKAMMMEAVQEIITLKAVHKPKAVWFWDELSFYLAAELPQSLASIRSAGMVMGIAYQSDQDMKALEDQNISADYIYNSVNVNAQIKLVYGGWDDHTATWISKLCGTIFKDVTTMTEVETNSAAAETWGKKSSVTKEEEALLPANLIKRLPKKVCVFLEPGELPKLCFTAHVPVEDFNALPAYLATLPRPAPLPASTAAIAHAPKPNVAGSQKFAATPKTEAEAMATALSKTSLSSPFAAPSSLVLTNLE